MPRPAPRIAARPRAAPASGASPILREVLAGLSRAAKSLPSHLFYDDVGTRLFQWISQLPEYYPTRVEREVLRRHGARIAASFSGRGVTLVDLGAGDGDKTRLIVEHLRRAGAGVTYAPVDVSRAALEAAAASMAAEGGCARIAPVHARYEEGVRRAAALDPGAPRLVLFLGSSIGNLEHAQARTFLSVVRRALAPGDHALVGFDLVKPLEVLRPAYDDPKGVTRAFNLNLLARLNRELGADFDLSAFRHVSTWDPVRPAMESWLESTRAQRVRIAGRTFGFARGERLHTEISCKYTPEMISAFARDAGFAEVETFTDRRGWFADALWTPGASP